MIRLIHNRTASMISRFFFFAGLLFLLFSCKNKEIDAREEAAGELFVKSAETLIDITEKINESKDSVEIDSLLTVYEKKITQINFACPPDTDLKLTEQDNDSLFHLIQILQETKQIKLKSFSINEKDTTNTEE